MSVELPVGSVVQFGGSGDVIDRGAWLVCDGRELPRVALSRPYFPDLFAVVGYKFTALPDGVTADTATIEGRPWCLPSIPAADGLVSLIRAA